MNLLFLGDSITDCDHCFSPDNLGYGYVKMLSDIYECETMLRDLSITNGGTDGFTFPRILQKWNQLYADKSWDVIFLLAGINEVGYLMSMTDSDESEITQYIKRSSTAFAELLSSMLFHQVKHIVILTPFLFEQPAYLRTWNPALQKICTMIDEVYRKSVQVHPEAEAVLSIYSLQDFFDKSAADISQTVLSEDGIHLTSSGHQLLSRYVYQILKNLPGV